MDRSELGAFLRAQRARLQPSDVGLLPAGGRRRTPGLRREEVAELSGVSSTWYTWLEQGRPIVASVQVIDALARALRLDPDRHRHLRTLAGLPVPQVETAAADVAPRLQRLVDNASPSPAAVYDRHFDFVVWNKPYVRVRHDPATLPDDRRNLMWTMFTDAEYRARMVRWTSAAQAVLGQFRTSVGQRPDDPRFTELVAALIDASPEFRTWWPNYLVRDVNPEAVEVDHPAAGRLSLELYQLRPVEFPDLLLVLQAPATPDDRRRVQGLLR
ncbi:helix-turn-helix transcriptional regulator [Cryptosporangium aurantiacum]|uniref:helix-turn-helix transcriptional regulator n=1 Tax=Cryptosporangium aurantiacum TaxID=134849 RepID=UPI0009349075|nr:helix-turn-helix transcriptional regulator [Cryptosporangium aurantiacum]